MTINPNIFSESHIGTTMTELNGMTTESALKLPDKIGSGFSFNVSYKYSMKRSALFDLKKPVLSSETMNRFSVSSFLGNNTIPSSSAWQEVTICFLHFGKFACDLNFCLNRAMRC